MIDELMLNFIAIIPHGFWGIIILAAIIAVSLYVLGKGADILVDEAVALSTKWGVPKMIIGATIVSLGTTVPEVTVSVMSALKGASELAMGNAIGSVICDTGLILGIAALIKPLPFKKEDVSRQGWIQLGSGVLIVVVSLIGSLFAKTNPFTQGGRVNQVTGFVLIALLALYILRTISLARKEGKETHDETENATNENIVLIFAKMILGVVLVILSSKVLIPAVQELALRFNIPETVIAATLVAFGTSLPELVTSVTAAKKGHGDLAIGNVIGADILNILFVIGASAAVTKGGLAVEPQFFTLLFPTMLFILFVFKGSVVFSKNSLKRPVGAVLLLAYLAVTVLSYIL